MLDENPADDQATTTSEAPQDNPAEQPAKKTAAKRTTKKAAAKKTAAKKAPAKSATKKSPAKKTAATPDETEQVSAETRASGADQAATEPAPAATEAGPESADEDVAAPAKKATRKAPAKKAAAKKAPAKRAAAKKTGEPAPETADPAATDAEDVGTTPPSAPVPLFQAPEPTKAAPRRKKAAAPAKKAAPAESPADDSAPSDGVQADSPAADTGDAGPSGSDAEGSAPRRRTRSARATAAATPPSGDDADQADEEPTGDQGTDDQQDDQTGDETGGGGRRRRRRGGRRRRRSGEGQENADGTNDDDQDEAESVSSSGRAQGKADPGKADQQGKADHGKADDNGGNGESTSSRRRRRRRRTGDDGDGSGDDPTNTVTRVRKPRNPEDEITALSGSTRLEAKKQRRREGREAGRRRAPIVSEAEFLARREAVERTMVIRQRKDLTQIAVLEDKVLVEHYVARESQTSLIGNVYLGRVQNVLPSMEAAFIDIGKGRNAVLYAGEVNWDALGAGNGPRKIEQVLKSGQAILVQVSKDPIGHKGARLTSQISLPGRFLVYVPDGTTSGISRKLPDTERTRLKNLLKDIVPESAGVIVRTAAEGASEEELTRDVERLTARWADIEAKAAKGNAPQMLYGEPDLTLKVVRDLFTEDFGKLVVSGDDAWDLVENYVGHVAPDLADRLEKYDGNEDVFAAYRIDEQIAKALDRKVWLPSGGSLVIDRTEAMTVVDVNTGKFTGSGGNLEETVTKNNLEAAEEIVRQLRLRDIGGIIVVDFIDMVLESNRDLVLRRMVECLGRDRTRHQVAEVTSLGLVQMTRKRIGTGLVEAFSETCEHCQGRGLVIHHEPVEQRRQPDEEPRRGGRGRSGRGRGKDDDHVVSSSTPSPRDIAAMARAAGRDNGESTDAAPESDAAPTSEASEKTSETASDRGSADQAASPGAAGAGDTTTTADRDTQSAPATRSTPTRRRRSSKPAGPAASPESSAAVADAATSADSAGVEAATSADSAGVEAATGADSAGERPVVRTRTRRGSSRREAGPPAGAGDATVTPTPASDGAATQPAATQPGANQPAASEPATQPAGPVANAPEPPKVVTSSRRRVARRPAGPPVGGATASADGGSPADAGGGSGEAPATPEEAAAVPAHVPVKKKGARKR